MASIKVTSEELQSVSSQLQSGSQEVSQQLSSMESRVKALVDADWQGAASDSFRDLWDKWHRGAADVQEALTGISQMVNQAAQSYEDTESQLASQLRG